MTTKRGYARRNLGGGNTLKAVTRASRATRPTFGPYGPWLKGPDQPNWRAAKRRALQQLVMVAEELDDGS